MPRCYPVAARRAYRGICLVLMPGFQEYLIPPPSKHVKIDDEERLHDDPKYAKRSRQAKMPRLLLLALLLLVILLLLLAYVVYKPPHFLIGFLQWKYPCVTFHLPLPPSQKLLALTIDDAPSSYTDDILDLLAHHDAKATFFIIGSQISRYPDVIQRIHDGGHELGNHAWKDEPSISLPPSELDRQIAAVDALLPPNPEISIPSPASGMELWIHSPRYFRPGSGFFNQAMVRRITALGYRVVLGSVYPHDAQIASAWINARHVLASKRPGSVIIMHDRRGYSTEQLRIVLEGLGKEGYRVGSLGDVIAAKGLA